MSHVSTVELVVTDLEALAQACERLGLELVRGQTTYKWFGAFMNDWNDSRAAALSGHDPATFGQSVHAIRVKHAPAGAYEIGLVARRDGKAGFDLVYDAWGAGGRAVERAAGTKCTLLREQYTAAVSRRYLLQRGYQVSERRNARGEIQVCGVKAG